MIPSVFMTDADRVKINKLPRCMLRNIPTRWADKLEEPFRLCDCWNWQGWSDGTSGYGKLKVFGKTFYAHRAFYEYLVGDIPSGILVHHLCYNRTCCNPLHLALASYRENLMDSPNKILFRKDYST